MAQTRQMGIDIQRPHQLKEHIVIFGQDAAQRRGGFRKIPFVGLGAAKVADETRRTGLRLIAGGDLDLLIIDAKGNYEGWLFRIAF